MSRQVPALEKAKRKVCTELKGMKLPGTIQVEIQGTNILVPITLVAGLKGRSCYVKPVELPSSFALLQDGDSFRIAREEEAAAFQAPWLQDDGECKTVEKVLEGKPTKDHAEHMVQYPHLVLTYYKGMPRVKKRDGASGASSTA